MNLTLKEILEKMDITFLESNTIFWSLPQRTYEVGETFEPFPCFMTVAAYMKTLDTNRTENS